MGLSRGWAATRSVFSFISYQNTRKRGQFVHFLLKIAEKKGKTDQRRAVLYKYNAGHMSWGGGGGPPVPVSTCSPLLPVGVIDSSIADLCQVCF